MISVNLKGGLGNILFQTAFIENASKKSGYKTFYPNIVNHLEYLNNENAHNANLNHAKDYLKIFKKFNWRIDHFGNCNKAIQMPFKHVLVNIVDETLYDGFFQSEKYFDNRKHILKLFEPSDFVLDKLSDFSDILEGAVCSIHVRRGDYLKFPEIHHPQTIEYYNSAMEAIGEVDRYLVFSDDMYWCRRNFKGDKFIFVDLQLDYIELFLQSKCTHNIISNSSFSWWGAWLNKNKDKKVVGPKNWFGSTHMLSKQTDDILPKSWIKL